MKAALICSSASFIGNTHTEPMPPITGSKPGHHLSESTTLIAIVFSALFLSIIAILLFALLIWKFILKGYVPKQLQKQRQFETLDDDEKNVELVN